MECCGNVFYFLSWLTKVLVDGCRSDTAESSKFVPDLSVHPSCLGVPNSLLVQETCYSETSLSQSSSVVTAWWPTNVTTQFETTFFRITSDSCMTVILPIHFNTLRTGLLNCLNARSGGLTFRHRASSIYGQAFRYSPENAFYLFNQQIYFIIWYLLDGASLI